MMKQSYVRFYTPGSLFSNTTTEEIDSWRVKDAVAMAKKMSPTPYAFSFFTRGRKDDELDAKIIRESPMYFLGGKLRTVEDVKRDNDPDEKILLSNMINNGYDTVITNTNSWKITLPFGKKDYVLDWPQ